MSKLMSIHERPAKGTRGIFLYDPINTSRYFFRVYDPDNKKKYTDYAVRAEEVEVELLSGRLSFYEGEGEAYLDFSNQARVVKKQFKWKVRVKGKEHGCSLASRPAMRIEETEKEVDGRLCFVPGRAIWQPLDLVLEQFIKMPKKSAAFEILMYALDSPVELWVLENARLTQDGCNVHIEYTGACYKNFAVSG